MLLIIRAGFLVFMEKFPSDNPVNGMHCISTILLFTYIYVLRMVHFNFPLSPSTSFFSRQVQCYTYFCIGQYFISFPRYWICKDCGPEKLAFQSSAIFVRVSIIIYIIKHNIQDSIKLEIYEKQKNKVECNVHVIVNVKLDMIDAYGVR